VTDANTVDRVRKLQNEATEIGHDHGWNHAAFVDAYGGNPHAEPDVPLQFAPVTTFYTTAYAEGVTAYLDGATDD
jgi:hypothetical protein